MDFLGFLLQRLVVIFIGIVVLFAVQNPHRRARARSQAVAEQTPVMTELAAKLGGSLSGPSEAAAWTPRLRRRSKKYEPELTLTFQRGPWHVRVTEACNPKPMASDALLRYEHWIEVATDPLPQRALRFDFFELSFEDGFVHTVCQGQIRADEIEFLVDMILETLDLMPGVEPGNPPGPQRGVTA
ncbi:hypothetical protein ABZX92_11270 [Lentzea sp. NPDC006480]|uniref:hypothetical protein n=1 Tax=Lentzea sp. NPDC006480 TaxID=3157176 RepID=UPI0033B2B5F2